MTRSSLQERLECSRATLTRVIGELRDCLGAPLEYDRDGGGYRYVAEVTARPMHHKRGRSRNRRAGCKLCKFWKVNGHATERPDGEKFGDHRRRTLAAADVCQGRATSGTSG